LIGVGVSVVQACLLTGYPRASFYRHHRPPTAPAGPARPFTAHRDRPQTSALSDDERGQILAVLVRPEYAALSVGQAFYRHWDTGQFIASRSSWYRVARDHGQTGDRRRQATANPKKIPELTATAANQVWSWDITKFRTGVRGRYWHLYAIVDIYSRYITGWAVHAYEEDILARDLIATSAAAHHGGPDYLHSDNGASMKSNAVATLSHMLGTRLSFSRPKVSNDNPYSEAFFKTIKYDLTFPETFTTLAEARAYCDEFFPAYNNHHRHSGIGYHTPANVHYGRTSEISAARRATLDNAWRDHPERFNTRPRPPRLPDRAHINNPDRTQALLSQAG